MIHPLVKIITVDGFFKEEEATQLSMCVENLQYQKTEFGTEIPNFNLIPENAGQLFSDIIGNNLQIDETRSGVFRFPELFVHFEGFDAMDEWCFVVALWPSTFNVYENLNGPKNALEGHKLGYRNMFEWDCKINYLLNPGQGVLFRPWLFHSFDSGLIQMFRLKEINNGN
jgi:hypothetical protein